MFYTNIVFKVIFKFFFKLEDLNYVCGTTHIQIVIYLFPCSGQHVCIHEVLHMSPEENV